MAGKKFKQRKTDVIQDGIVYRMYKERYSVYTYTEDLPEKVIIADKIRITLDPKDFEADGNVRTIIHNVDTKQDEL